MDLYKGVFNLERLEEIKARKLEIRTMLDSEDCDVEAIETELNALDEEERSLVQQIAEEKRISEETRAIENEQREIAERKKEAEALNVGKVLGNELKERKMENVMTRDSAQYIDAYAEFLKTGDDTQCRALLTENASGTVAIPTMVLDEVKHAWENEGIMALVRRVSVKGNLKVNFEKSSEPAVFHTEGGEAISVENLVEGIVTIIPQMAKKVVALSDEAMSLRGEAFINYIVAEISHKIAKLLADTLVGKIVALPATATATSVSADKIAFAPAVGTVAKAIAHLSDEATNPVIIMNKLTYADFKDSAYGNNYGVDPFEGCRVLFNNTLPSYASASTSDVYMIVGDLREGALANFPNGEGIEIVVDALTRKKEDLVEFLGKEYVGLGLISDKAFTLVSKPTNA